MPSITGEMGSFQPKEKPTVDVGFAGDVVPWTPR